MRRTLVLGLFAVLACSSPEENLPDSGKDAGADAGPDSGRDGGIEDSSVEDSGVEDTGPITNVPILERTPELAYDCASQLPVTQPVERAWSGYGWTYGLVESGSSLMFGRIERMGDPFVPPTSIETLISTISSDGTMGPAVQINAAMPDTINAVSLAPIGSGVLFAYADANGAQIARIDGTTVDGPKEVLSANGGTPERVKLATSGDRGAIVFGARGADDRVSYRIQTIDSTGALVGSPYEVVRAARTYLDPGANIVATPNGYAVVWRDTKTDQGEIYFRLFGTDGQPAGDTKTIFSAQDQLRAGQSVGFESTSIPILPLPNGEFLVAWVESNVPLNDSGAWAMVALLRLNAAGDPVGERALLATPEVDFDHVEPELFLFKDAVGLAWGKGDHIYICAGCVPNHSLRLVLIDPARMIPVSEVAELDAQNGGILYRATHPIGDDIVSVFRLVFHVHSEAGYAAFRCTAR